MVSTCLFAFAGGLLVAILVFAFAPLVWFGRINPYLGLLVSWVALIVVTPLAVFALLSSRAKG